MTVFGFNDRETAERLAATVRGPRRRVRKNQFSQRPPTAGGTGGSTVFVAELNEAWSSGVAECSIYTMDGLTLTDTTQDLDVYDPLEAFAILGIGDRMYVTLQGGKYYASNNAPCPAGE